MRELFSSFPTLCCGYDFIITIDEYNNIFSFGSNDSGQCGQDTVEEVILFPKKINTLNNIQFISCGVKHSLCCDYNGNIFSFGCNSYGQLGLNKTYGELQNSSIQQINLPIIQQISCGYYFSLCLSIDGEVWSFGENKSGQLGVGNRKSSPKPLKINNLSNINYIISGGKYCYCKTELNEYYSWGNNKFGELAQGHTDDLTIPHLCNNIPDDIVSIRAGSSHLLFLTSNGIVYSCGSNTHGELGQVNTIIISIPKIISSLPFIKKISCGYNHSLCVDMNNSLWVFGYNIYGQLGLGHNNKINIPTKNDLLQNIIDISYRCHGTIIKTQDNKIYASGLNSHSQLGIQTGGKSITIPTQILKDKEDIWVTIIQNSRIKSARK